MNCIVKTDGIVRTAVMFIQGCKYDGTEMHDKCGTVAPITCLPWLDFLALPL